MNIENIKDRAKNESVKEALNQFGLTWICLGFALPCPLELSLGISGRPYKAVLDARWRIPDHVFSLPAKRNQNQNILRYIAEA